MSAPIINPVFIVYGVVLARAVYDRHGARLAAEYDALSRRLSRFSRRQASRMRGALFDRRGERAVEDALRDLADVNGALAKMSRELGLGDLGGNERFRCQLVVRERAPSWVPMFARRAMCECGVDIERVPASEVDVAVASTSDREQNRGGRWLRAAYGYVAQDGGAAVSSVSGAADADDGYEMVHVIRHATFDEFYGSLKPLIQQLVVDFEAELRGAHVGAQHSNDAEAVAAPGNLDEEDEDNICSICMDARLRVVVNCGHAFCDECHTRWLRVSMTCPVCRAALPRETPGESDASFALVDYDDVREVLGHGARRNVHEIAHEWRQDISSRTTEEIESDLRHRAALLAERIGCLPPAAERRDAFASLVDAARAVAAIS
ncbi:Zinc finger, RING/FYVE/PHD-type [Ostreococcus tauri]|nr:Zinc finger, RING/FYVE/PHD-type [Ostreococcus tauri]CEF99462.1 Zinc finger, RING/FYVE/PHD-type [Ostreococcus tauri]|eukprot:XP_003081741.2 Zinc finger, RING/FYVE/PHD-type [Ostreococcus tauri]